MSAKLDRFDLDPVTEDGRLSGVLDPLCEANEATFRRRGRVIPPSRPAVAALVEEMRGVL